MWTITAKEGDPTAQRELAIFYLSNPELVQRTTLPLSKPREVFKQTVMDKYGGGGGGGGSGSRYHHHHHHGAQGRAAQGAGAGGGAGQGGGAGGAGGGGGAGGKEDVGLGDVRSDPALMCVAIHWMEAASNGGDELAKTFMAQNEMGLMG